MLSSWRSAVPRQTLPYFITQANEITVAEAAYTVVCNDVVANR